MIESSASVFRSAHNGDPKKIRKIDKIKQELVYMLRESLHHMQHLLNQSTTIHIGEIGFKLSNGRLPWSTLDGDLRRKGYMIVNWPQGVIRDRDKGVSGLSAEDADKLHAALFVDERRIRFVPCGEGRLGVYGTIGRSLNLRPESAYNNDGIISQAVASGSDGPPRERLFDSRQLGGVQSDYSRSVSSQETACVGTHFLVRDYDFHGRVANRFIHVHSRHDLLYLVYYLSIVSVIRHPAMFSAALLVAKYTITSSQPVSDKRSLGNSEPLRVAALTEDSCTLVTHRKHC